MGVGLHYVLLDGDSIGAPLEWHLLHDDARAAAEWSRRVARAMDAVRELIQRDPLSNVLYMGGDDLLATVPAELVEALIPEVCRAFREATGTSMSSGIGNSPSSALLALRKAKCKRWM